MTSFKPPLIAVAIDENTSDGATMYESNKKLTRLLDHFGAAVTFIPYSKRSADWAINSADALMCQGGRLGTPKHYWVNNEEDTDHVSERFEHLQHLIPGFVETGKPYLGFCLGMQVLAGYYGCKLKRIEDTANRTGILHNGQETGENGRLVPVTHPINIKPDTTLHQLIQKARITVNSSHNTCIAKLSDGFLASARSDDGMIEAVEMKKYPDAMGIQWHPYKNLDDSAEGLFKNFIRRATKIRDYGVS